MENQMPKIFPDRLMTLARNPKVKKAIILEYEQEAGQCQNCGGIGFLSFFLATMGPFDEAGGGRLVSKFHDGKWWAAPGYIEPSKDTEKTNMRFGTVSAPCPVCKGIRKRMDGPYVPMPDSAREAMVKIKAKMNINARGRR
jgi:hypothetical protein